MTTVDGSGIAEFDQLVQKNMSEIDALKGRIRTGSDGERSDAQKDLRLLFSGIVADARNDIGNRDDDGGKDSADETRDKDAVDDIGTGLDDLTLGMGQGGADFVMGGDTLPKLSEIKWINTIDSDTREVVLHDGRKIKVENSLNQELFFGLSLDLENQLKEVSADQAPHNLLDEGYGLVSNNELTDIVGLMAKTKKGTIPVVEMKGDHIVTLRFTAENGREHRYFAYDNHSPDAFEGLRAVGQWLRIPGVRDSVIDTAPPGLGEPEDPGSTEPDIVEPTEPEDTGPKPEDVAAGGYELIEQDLLKDVYIGKSPDVFGIDSSFFRSERIAEPAFDELKDSKEYKDAKGRLELDMFFDDKGHTVGHLSHPEEFPGFMRFEYQDDEGNTKKYFIDKSKTPGMYDRAVHMSEHVRAIENAQAMGWSIWDSAKFNTGESQLREIEDHFQNEELGIIGIKFHDSGRDLLVPSKTGSLVYGTQYHDGEYIIFSKERTPEAYDVIRKYVHGPHDLGDGFTGNDHSNTTLTWMYSASHWTDYDKPGDLKLESVLEK